MEWGFTSVDGSKFVACNSKNNNFTKSNLDDRIKWLNGHIDEYLRILDDVDKQEDLDENPKDLTKKFIEEKLREVRERLEKYEGYQKVMEESSQSQMSLTDADARLMKSKIGFAVAYNPQTAVDSNTSYVLPSIIYRCIHLLMYRNIYQLYQIGLNLCLLPNMRHGSIL